jgi:hypothetical protein
MFTRRSVWKDSVSATNCCRAPPSTLLMLAAVSFRSSCSCGLISTSDCWGVPLPWLIAAWMAPASVVNPSIMRRREASVKTAMRVPGGIRFRYASICWRTYA